MSDHRIIGYKFPSKVSSLLTMKIVALLLLLVSTSVPVASGEFVLCGITGYCNTDRAECVNGTNGEVATCVCDAGYTGENCIENLDECNSTQAEYPCKGPEGSSFCVNDSPPKKYKCGCNSGWEAVISNATNVTDPVPSDWRPLDCLDIDECSDSTLNECTVDTDCVNTAGSYDCTCQDDTLVWSGTACVDPPTAAPTTAAPTAAPTTAAPTTPAPTTASPPPTPSVSGASTTVSALAVLLVGAASMFAATIVV